MEEATIPITAIMGWSSRAKQEVLRLMNTSGSSGLAVVASEPIEPLSGARLVRGCEQVAERSLGCPCCAIRLDVHQGIHRLIARRRPPSRIAVVAGAGTDPGPLLTTLLCDVLLRRRTALDALVTTIDGPEAAVRLAIGQPLASSGAAEEHVALADAIVVVGGDRLTEDARQGVRAAIRHLNPFSPVWMPAEGEELPVFAAPGEAYSLAGVGARLDALAPPASSAPCSALIDLEGEADADELQGWAKGLFRGQGRHLLRLQAVCSVRGQVERWVCSGVRSVYATGGCGPSPLGCPAARVLAVGRNLNVEELTASLSGVLVRRA